MLFFRPVATESGTISSRSIALSIGKVLYFVGFLPMTIASLFFVLWLGWLGFIVYVALLLGYLAIGSALGIDMKLKSLPEIIFGEDRYR